MVMLLLLQSEAASEVLKRRGTLHSASAADKVEVHKRRSRRGTVPGAGAAAACEAAALCEEELFMVLLLQCKAATLGRGTLHGADECEVAAL